MCIRDRGEEGARLPLIMTQIPVSYTHLDVYKRQPQPFAIQVSLGVARELSEEPSSLLYFIDDPVQIAGMERGRLSVRLYSGAPFAPPGRGVMIIPLDSTHEYWAGLYRDPALYRETKAAAAEKVIDLSLIHI